jgi:hypothetical protein
MKSRWTESDLARWHYALLGLGTDEPKRKPPADPPPIGDPQPGNPTDPPPPVGDPPLDDPHSA